jgi:proliferating cell nuclear antigen
MKLMDIDSDTLAIPDTDYDARVTMSSAEFSRIVRDLSLLGESVKIEVGKEGVSFSSDGEAASGNVLLKETEAARKRYENWGVGGQQDAEDVKHEDKDIDMDGEEKADGDGDGEEEFKPESDDEEKPEENGDEEGDTNKKKRKKGPVKARIHIYRFHVADTSFV